MVPRAWLQGVTTTAPSDIFGSASSLPMPGTRLIRTVCDRGAVLIKCRLNLDLRPGVIVIPEGFWVKDFPEGDPYSLTHELVSPTSENYAFFGATLAEVEPDHTET